MKPTPFDKQCQILAELWMNCRNDEEFQDFFAYNDLGLPLAYAIAEKIANPNELTERFVGETWGLLLASLEIEDEGNYDNLDDLLNI